MSYSFKRSLDRLFEIEGIDANHANDRGGATKFGISTAFLKEIKSPLKVTSITKDKAEELYKEYFWDKMNCSQIASYDENLAFEVFEFGVHAGHHVAQKTFQRVLNLLNRNGKDYDDVKEDGLIGVITLTAYSEFISKRKEDNAFFIGMYNVAQGAYYMSITSSEKGKMNEQFIYGWFKKRVLNA